jgi:valyl-tRNA synthetase
MFSAGNDLLYDDSLPEQGRKFANKIWNAFRLVKSWKTDDKISQPESSAIAVRWMNEVLKKSTAEIDANFRKFRISEALMSTYRLFWDEFSGWYLEIIKPGFKKPVDKVTYEATITIFDALLHLIHPFMPFITEEIWQLLSERKDGESIMISRMPSARKFNRELIARFSFAKDIVSAIRTIRTENHLLNRDPVKLLVRAGSESFNTELPVVRKLCNVSDVEFVSGKQEGAVSFMVGTTEFFIPLSGKMDIESERTRLKSDLEYYRGFLSSVMKKLDNEKFVQNAPANVLELERKKKADAEMKIRMLEDSLNALK